MSDRPIQYDVSALESDPTFYRELFHQFDIAREFCIPCIVTEYNAEKNTVKVQPLPNRVYDDGTKMAETPRSVFEVPVLKYAHGGFQILSPIFVGDTGYVIACDRSCKKLTENNKAVLFRDDTGKEINKGNGSPDDYSLTSYAKGFFIPCSWMDQTIPPKDKGKFVISGIGKKDGDDKWQKISMSNDGVIELLTKDKSVKVSNDSVDVASKNAKVHLEDGAIYIEVGDRKLTLSNKGLQFEGPTDEKVKLISEIRYDVSSHQIQAKTLNAERSGNLFVNVGSPSNWDMIEGGQAVPVE